MGDSLVRPRLSSEAKKLAGLFARERRKGRLSVISVIVRRDGAVAIKHDNDLEGAEKGRTPVIFHFRAPGAAEAVVAGALRCLANERVDESKLWYLDISAGQAAAAIKAEAKGSPVPSRLSIRALRTRRLSAQADGFGKGAPRT
jgi:hypothetical protein